MLTPQQQAGSYYARRNRRSRVLVQNLTKWHAGLVVTAGQYVQSFSRPYRALGSGTTGATAPHVEGGRQSDGTITWQFVDAASLLRPPATP